MTESDIIYDWNVVGDAGRPPQPVIFYDETLRDGIQSPSVFDPDIDDKLKILHYMDQLGLQYADVGLPGAGPRAVEDVTQLVREIRDAKLSIKPSCAARTAIVDIQPIVDISQQLGVEIEVMAFIGSSTIRLYAEAWDLSFMQKHTEEAVDFCIKHNLPCCYVTEDTSRAHPEILTALFDTAMRHGAHRLCLCDTVGHATPEGVRELVRWTQQLVKSHGAQDTVKLDWHGHNDRGLAVYNALVAAQAGVDRIHGTALGIGERVGNAAIDQILLNMKLLGWIDQELSQLVAYCQTVSKAVHVPVPCNYPLIGDDAFRTATGVHAAAVIKAERRGDTFLADRIYSGVPASLFGKAQEIVIGPMSGESNVIYWLKQRQVEPEPVLVKQIFAAAKAQHRLLTDEEIWRVIDDYRRKSS